MESQEDLAKREADPVVRRLRLHIVALRDSIDEAIRLLVLAGLSIPAAFPDAKASLMEVRNVLTATWEPPVEGE